MPRATPLGAVGVCFCTVGQHPNHECNHGDMYPQNLLPGITAMSAPPPPPPNFRECFEAERWHTMWGGLAIRRHAAVAGRSSAGIWRAASRRPRIRRNRGWRDKSRVLHGCDQHDSRHNSYILGVNLEASQPRGPGREDFDLFERRLIKRLPARPRPEARSAGERHNACESSASSPSAPHQSHHGLPEMSSQQVTRVNPLPSPGQKK